MAEKFIKSGYEVVENWPEAGICVVNTCSVTNISARKSRQMFRKVKEKNPQAIVVVTGCYAQVSKNEIEQMSEADIIMGNNEKKDVVKYVEEFLEQRNKKVEVEDIFVSREFVDFGTITYTEKTRAAIKIQDGCNRFCSYCIIPYARGRVRSRKPESVISEIKAVAQKGIQEVVITGIHIASYGNDFKEEYSLIDLLEEINKIEGIKRIRLGSIEPPLITEQFIKRLSKLEKICEHFHLSLQSGCDDTLKRMNRRYTTEEFKQVVERLRKVYKDVILTTDIIVGFPGETKEEFNQTYEFLKEIKFYKMHIFPYSIREGTKAAEMPNQVDGAEKERRSKILLELSDKNQVEYNNEYIGKEVEVLIEENSKGHTANYILVKVEEVEIPENSICKLKVIGVNEEALMAKVD